MCYVVLGVVCLVCSVVDFFFFCFESQNNEETAECGAGREELRSPESEALPIFKCN